MEARPVDTRVWRGLWQALVLGGIGAALAISAGAELPIGSAGWLVLGPLVALGVACRAQLAQAGRQWLAPARPRQNARA